jgi:hypothetical protein
MISLRVQSMHYAIHAWVNRSDDVDRACSGCGCRSALLVDLAGLAGIGPGVRVVEVGPGTGQGTTALTALGAHVTAVELGPALASVLRSYEQEIAYSAHGYLELLATYSGHRALAPEQRAGLFACVGELIDSRYGGTVSKRYLYELRLARRSA